MCAIAFSGKRVAWQLWCRTCSTCVFLQAERRDRLRKLLAQRDAEQGNAPSVGQVVLQEQVALQDELFYTEGSPELQEARKAIAQYSLQRASQRIMGAKRRREDAEEGSVRGVRAVERCCAAWSFQRSAFSSCLYSAPS